MSCKNNLCIPKYLTQEVELESFLQKCPSQSFTTAGKLAQCIYHAVVIALTKYKAGVRNVKVEISYARLLVFFFLEGAMLQVREFSLYAQIPLHMLCYLQRHCSWHAVYQNGAEKKNT